MEVQSTAGHQNPGGDLLHLTTCKKQQLRSGLEEAA
jgi:hypothetical protein